MIKSRRMRWAGHVTHKGGCETSRGFLLVSLKRGAKLEDQGVDGRIILKWI
jgi:hypothetical protein